MNKILDQLVEDKYGYSMRDSDSSTYEKTAGWEKEYVNGFMEEAKSGKYDFVFVCQTESVIDEMDRRKIPYIIVDLTISYGISKKPKSEQRKDKSLSNNGSVGLYFGIIHISRIFQSG